MNYSNIKESRFYGLTETIDFYYCKVILDGCKLSKNQRAQLEETKDQISVFGEKAQKWYDLANEILNS